mmetsp:Transcript_1378/g.4467  ORF Transcript_1378/g.4467 Transcript_1378/m.4467 type:complete len:241 (+) Transcript_1378:740-1462(+)
MVAAVGLDVGHRRGSAPALVPAARRRRREAAHRAVAVPRPPAGGARRRGCAGRRCARCRRDIAERAQGPRDRGARGGARGAAVRAVPAAPEGAVLRQRLRSGAGGSRQRCARRRSRGAHLALPAVLRAAGADRHRGGGHIARRHDVPVLGRRVPARCRGPAHAAGWRPRRVLDAQPSVAGLSLLADVLRADRHRRCDPQGGRGRVSARVGAQRDGCERRRRVAVLFARTRALRRDGLRLL